MIDPVRQALFGLGCCGALFSASPDPDDELAAAIRARDSQFWSAYNTCDMARVPELFTSDVEFYHDKSGPSVGRDALIKTLKVDLCANGGSRLRRAPVPGTDAIFPLRKGNEIYGAILSGEHVFYVSEPGKQEYLDGRANYTHLWLKQDGQLRMARILSYNHRPANERKEIVLSHEELEQLAGAYRSPKFGPMTVAREDRHLVVHTETAKFVLYPQTPHMFFVNERDLTFEFQFRDGKPVTMIVREKGAIVDTVPRAE